MLSAKFNITVIIKQIRENKYYRGHILDKVTNKGLTEKVLFKYHPKGS